MTRAASLVFRHVPFNLLLQAADASPVVIFYHSVSDVPLPHISPLYRHRTLKEFEADIDFLLRYLQPLTSSELLAAAAGEPAKRGFFVTFDDGLREVAELAAPILQRKGVPAAVFVNSAFLDNARLFYRFQAALLITSAESAETSATRECLAVLAEREIGAPSLPAALRAVPYAKRDVFDGIAKILGVDFGAFLASQRPYLTSGQLSELRTLGWEIGGHSIDHPRYSELTLEEQLRQTRESMKRLAEVTGTACSWFAFPFTAEGISNQFYEAALSENPGTAFLGTGGWFHDPTRRLLNRVSFEGEKPPARRFAPESLGIAGVRRFLGRSH